MSYLRTAPVPLLDLSRQHASLRPRLLAAFAEVLDSGRFILGDAVEQFEHQIADFVGSKEAIGVSNGTDALVLALQAAGVGPGDEVITTAFTFFATVGAILRVGARPRFADIEPGGFNLDPARVEDAITPNTRAVVCVHLFGDPAQAHSLRALCDARGLVLIEDAAQALGAAIGGARVGSIGHLGCFSFFPSKPLGGLGDGGMVTTSNPQLAERCRLLRAHGAPHAHHHVLLGGNYRLDALQAALLSVKLERLEEWLTSRAQHAAAYDARFSARPELSRPACPPGSTSALAHYTLRLMGDAKEHRAEVVNSLRAAGISTGIYYSRPVYAQSVPELRATLLGNEAAENPQTEERCREVLTLPLFPELTSEERERVISALLESLS